jgi:hypothetical protein
MDKSRNKFSEKVRVIISRELDLPPDDVDMSSILDCVERAIKKSCKKENGEIIISFDNKKEEEAILSDYGRETIGKIFSNEFPFSGYISDYQDWYVSSILKNIYDKRDIT